jgi:acetyl-CoA/propionyl-CoA carboxylase, biotin carboxylase, biotin carboxyl carrier protein
VVGKVPGEEKDDGRYRDGTPDGQLVCEAHAWTEYDRMPSRDAPFSKVLVANRGEIAVRVFRTLRELSIGCVAVYSEADRAALHVRRADEAYLIGAGPPAESYLNVERIVETALRAGAEALHPGYGFLAENAGLARACEDAGVVWIGPPPEAIETMGSKVAARRTMAGAGIPVVPGTIEALETAAELVRLGEEYGWPLAVKASAGGGGKGLKVVWSRDEAERAFTAAQREGGAYFSDATVYVEKYLDDPRHVEVQVLADDHGNVVHLGERDCTIQRRHQKLVEETPSPAVGPELRERIGAIAVDAARAVGYRSAGTVEGLLDRDGNYFFLEMNTRIQVEHTVTELVTGLDLVREQILIAAGEPLAFSQADVGLHGHAIECRINAEDPSNGFLPAPGRVTIYREPGGPGVRVDSGVEEGDEISPLYDPLVAKLVVHGVDREHARRRTLRALDEFAIGGVATLLGFHRALLETPCFAAGETCHGVVESEELAGRARELGGGELASPAADGTARVPRAVAVEVSGRRFDVNVLAPEPPYRELARRRRERARSAEGPHGVAAHDAVTSPMQGTVLAVHVAEGEEVRAGQVVCVIEAMKMENEITAQRHGRITELSVAPGEPVSTGQVICVVAQAGEPEADGTT